MQRKILVALAILGFVVYAGLMAATWWGRSTLRAYASAWQVDVAAERSHEAARRHPVLRGEPLDEDAAPLYRSLLDRLDNTDFALIASAAKDAPPKPEAFGLLERHRAELDALEEPLHCTRCDWHTKFEDGYEAWIPNVVSAKMLSDLLRLDGNVRAASSDSRGAAARYLDALRFGADLGRPGVGQQVPRGMQAQGQALEALTRLVVERDDAPLDDIELDAHRLEPVSPGPADVLCGERLCLGWLATGQHPEHPALIARGVLTADELFRLAERIALTDARGERSELVRRLHEVSPTFNPIAALVVPDLDVLLRRGDELAARYRLLEAAIGLERRRRTNGRYDPRPDLPVDPCAPPAKLHYEPGQDGKTYRLWSVGDAKLLVEHR